VLALIAISLGDRSMANLIVRGISELVVRALKEKAGREGTSAEAMHRRILEQALTGPKKRSFAQVISSMPDVGRDEDFARHQEVAVTDVLS
jgi:plasmid stability protein|tara:strand:+ start:2110 stop:2382 length:273 start_codon:yes stop_codon:yes gene_type:complete